MQVLWESLKNEDVQNNVDWDKMYSTIVKNQEDADRIIHRSTVKNRNYYLTVALSSIFIIGAAVFWIMNHQSYRKKPEIPQSDVSSGKRLGNTHQTIHLPDGSTVVLNTGSTLNYPSAFSNGRRDVYLSGEGYFDIKHNPSQPFYVHTGSLLVKVLGTVFNIRSYPEQDDIQVTVTSGKVQVLKENKTLGILTASQQISFANSSEIVLITNVDTLAVTAWRPSELHFNDITMDEVAQKLRQRFNIVIEFANREISECRVTATFSENDTVEEVLDVICAVSKANYSFNNNKIVIDGKGCN